jgi:hypothetical protein
MEDPVKNASRKSAARMSDMKIDMRNSVAGVKT